MKRRPPIKLQDLLTLLATLPPGHLLLTKEQMSGVIQVSIRTITAMMASGELPYLKLRGRFVRFRLEDVHRHLSEHALVCKCLRTATTDQSDKSPSTSATSAPHPDEQRNA
jgi:excisionase family DNA binding protein